MSVLSDKIAIVEESITALPNFDWNKIQNSGNISEYQNLLTSLDAYIRDLADNSPNDDVKQDLKNLMELFNTYACFAGLPNLQKQVRDKMITIVNNLKKSFPA